jgi:uncharacterized delta-60 repeat protein
VAIQADGKIVAGGYSQNAGSSDFALARYNADGSLDTSFDSDGMLITDFDSSEASARSVAIQADGKIVAAGYSYIGGNGYFALARYSPDGSLDTSFDADGKVTVGWDDGAFGMAIQADGKIVAAGSSFNGNDSDFAVIRVLGDAAPTATIDQATNQADPTAGPTISFDVVFAAPVTGFDASDIDFTGSTVGGTLGAAVTGSGAAYTVTVTGMTGAGTVVASIPAGAATGPGGITTLASTSTDNAVTFDGIPPAVTVEQAAGQADPTTVGPITFAVHFSEAVSGFDGSDVSFAGSTVGGTLVADVSGSGADYAVTVTGMTGQGTVVAGIPVGAAADAAGNGSSASTGADNTVTFDNEAPTVTVNQAAGQTDPTNVASIQFDVVFSEPVSGFDPADVSFAGSTVGGTLRAGVAASGDTYIVTVTGMTTRGSVVVSVPAGGANDLAGNASLASTSTDNSVEFLNTGTVGFSRAVYDTTEDATAHTVTVTATRAGQTDGAVSVTLVTGGGTAHSGGLVATGQDDYTPTAHTFAWADGVGGDQTWDITINPDALNEGRELIALALTDPVGSPGLGLTGASVAIAPSDGQGPGTYRDQDGDKVTIKLTGKTGSLQWFRTDPDGDGKGPIELVELAGTLPDPLKPKASLVVAVAKSKTTTDGGTVGLGAITGSGLKGISARKANLNLEGIHLAGYLGALTIGNILNGADIATLAGPTLKQTTRINAVAIGAGTVIDVGAPISSLTATSFGAGSVKAPSIGALTVKGNMAADVTVSGAGVDPTKKALGVLRVKGAVTGSDIMVAGNVGAVVVGAFRDSRLFAGYAGPDVPDPAGFNLPATVTTFRATGKVDGFQNSRVIATAFKSVGITNFYNSPDATTEFGFYADVSLGAISVTGPTKWKYNSALPTPQGVGDFEVQVV